MRDNPGMLDLLLLRHAKSSWDERGVDDHDRGLTKRGLKAAAQMGRLMHKEGLTPDLALCSTAARASLTMERVARAFEPTPPIKELRTLYLATPGRLLETIRRQDPDAGRLLVVGHNPGLHSLAVRLVGSGDKAARERLEGNLPTAALVRILFDADAWSQVVEAQGELAGYWRPRELE